MRKCSAAQLVQTAVAWAVVELSMGAWDGMLYKESQTCAARTTALGEVASSLVGIHTYSMSLRA